MNKKIVRRIAWLLTLALLISASMLVFASEPEDLTPEEIEARMGGTVLLRIGGDPVSLNPSLFIDDNAYPAMQNMFNRLTKLDAGKKPIPDAAASWDISDDALEITFHLKEGQKWWDGEDLDAEDVKYTFDYIKENKTSYFSSSMDIVDSIEIIDPLTVTFHMNTADLSFVARIGWYGTFIVPEHIFNNGQPWEENEASLTTPVGSGPFKFESYKQGESLTLVKNEDYHEKEPYLDRLVYQIIPDDTTAALALQNGELDVLEFVPDAFADLYEADPNIRMDRNFYPSPWRFIINMDSDIMSDPAVRLAFALCIDRNDLSEKVTGGIMPPEWCAYPAIMEWVANTEDIYPDVDIEAARQVLEDAGFEADADGYYIRGMTLDAFEGPLVDMSRLVIANAAEAGMEIELIVSEYNAWNDKVVVGGDWMIEAQGGFLGPDPAALQNRYGTSQSGNKGNYSNAEFDELLTRGAGEGDQDERAAIYREAQKILIDELPAINVLAYAGYEAANASLHDLPIDGVDRWGWQEYTYTYFAD